MQCGNIVRRVTVMVRDAEASANFYQTCFGFTVYSDQSITLRQGTPVAIGDPSSPQPGRFITVKGRHPLAGMIGLISIEGETQDRLPDGKLGIGNVVLVLETEDIDDAARHIETLGGSITMAIHDAENTGDEDGNKVPSRRLFALDPDGVVLEVFQPC